MVVSCHPMPAVPAVSPGFEPILRSIEAVFLLVRLCLRQLQPKQPQGRPRQRSVTEQSDLYAGDDGYHITVEQHTDLKGCLITSSQKAEDDCAKVIAFADFARSPAPLAPRRRARGGAATTPRLF